MSESEQARPTAPIDFHLTDEQYRLGQLEIERMKKELEAYRAKHLSE